MNIERYKEAIEWLENEDNDFANALEAACALRETIDDLITAGALVPVPVGEPCLIASRLSSGEVKNFMHDGHVQYIEPENGLQVNMNHEEGDSPYINSDTIVQPVRLMPLAELLEAADANHD